MKFAKYFREFWVKLLYKTFVYIFTQQDIYVYLRVYQKSSVHYDLKKIRAQIFNEQQCNI